MEIKVKESIISHVLVESIKHMKHSPQKGTERFPNLF